MNTSQLKSQEKIHEDPHKGVDVGMATGKLFESQMLGDLSSKRILESFQGTLFETFENAGVSEKELSEAIKYIVFRDGVNQGKRKWSSLGVFMQTAFGSIKNGNEKEKAEAYYDFNELLIALGDKRKFPHLKKIPSFLSRDVETNMSLEIARRSQPDMSMKKFGATIVSNLQQKFPQTKFKIISGLGTPMDYVQKIDFVVAVVGKNDQILRYYSYDLKTHPNKHDSIMRDVVVVMPDDLQATLEERTRNCIDNVVQNVVERESRVTPERSS